MTNGNPPPGWYVDPTGQGDARYWNGTSRTQAVDRNGQQVNVIKRLASPGEMTL